MAKTVKTYPGKNREIWEEFREFPGKNIAISREFPGREIPAANPMTKFRSDWVKIVDFLIKALFLGPVRILLCMSVAA